MNGDSITGPKLVIMLNDMPLTTDMEKTRKKKKKEPRFSKSRVTFLSRKFHKQAASMGKRFSGSGGNSRATSTPHPCLYTSPQPLHPLGGCETPVQVPNSLSAVLIMALLQTVCPSLHPALDSNIPLVSPALCSLLDHQQHWLQVASK